MAGNRYFASTTGRWHCRTLQVCVFLFVANASAPAQTSPHGNIAFQCEECHSAASWKEMTYPSKFQHAKTGFGLNGQHALLRCTECHATLKFTVTGKICADCHDDVHRSELGRTCDRCHTPDSWLVPDMVQRHAKTRFALVGAHANANCQACHKNQQVNEFINVRTDCFGCHQSDFETTTSPNHRLGGYTTDCLSCHTMSGWHLTSFDHNKTAFKLMGAHLAIACNGCHKNNVFKGTPTLCIGCHQTDFLNAANPRHSPGFSTVCTTCHTLAAWQPASFDHSKSSFPLTGAHTTISCASCHGSGVYTGTPNTCGNSSCHLAKYNATTNPQHAGAGFPIDCQTCHSTTAWIPSSFNHTPFFPISAGSRHSPGRWTVCADCHTISTNFKVFSCIDCHQHQPQSRVDSQHGGRAGYSYVSTACYNCHPRGTSN